MRNPAEQLLMETMETAVKARRTKGNCRKAHWQTMRSAALLCDMRNIFSGSAILRHAVFSLSKEKAELSRR